MLFMKKSKVAVQFSSNIEVFGKLKISSKCLGGREGHPELNYRITVWLKLLFFPIHVHRSGVFCPDSESSCCQVHTAGFRNGATKIDLDIQRIRRL